MGGFKYKLLENANTQTGLFGSSPSKTEEYRIIIIVPTLSIRNIVIQLANKNRYISVSDVVCAIL